MANKMQAVAKYSPRIAPGPPVHDDDAIAHMTQDTGQTEGEALQSIRNVIRTLRFYLTEGRSVHLDDLGSFSVHVSLDGTFGLDFRADPDLTRYVKDNFRGQLDHKDNLGKTMADLVAQWNADPANVDDPIEIA